MTSHNTYTPPSYAGLIITALLILVVIAARWLTLGNAPDIDRGTDVRDSI